MNDKPQPASCPVCGQTKDVGKECLKCGAVLNLELKIEEESLPMPEYKPGPSKGW